MTEYSASERALLHALQQDASASLSALAERCGMAQSTVWRKLQEFEKSGLIRARVALLDPAQAGVKLMVLASVQLHDHSEEAIREFAAVVRAHPEILECHAVSGEADYMLKVRVADVEAYERFMTHTLLRNRVVRSVHSSFVLKEIKATTELPL